MNSLDLRGQRFGRVVAVRPTYKTVRVKGREHRRRSWECLCDCGATVVVWTAKLTSGHTQSCGCYGRDRSRETAKISSRKHGGYGSPEYRIWRGMLNRCHLPSDGNYSRYGARGIHVCDRWRFGESGQHPFECFLADMGPRPTPQHSLDRYPNGAGHYEPGNVRWATHVEQANNKRHGPAYRNQPRGAAHPDARLNESQVRAIRRSAAAGQSIASLAREYGVSEGAVRGIVKRRTWKHVIEDGELADSKRKTEAA